MNFFVGVARPAHRERCLNSLRERALVHNLVHAEEAVGALKLAAVGRNPLKVELLDGQRAVDPDKRGHWIELPRAGTAPGQLRHGLRHGHAGLLGRVRDVDQAGRRSGSLRQRH